MSHNNTFCYWIIFLVVSLYSRDTLQQPGACFDVTHLTGIDRQTIECFVKGKNGICVPVLMR